MGLQFYLAMDPSEIQRKLPDTGSIAWFSCQFSPDGEDLSNLPRTLPEGSALILDDGYLCRQLNTRSICRSLGLVAERLRLRAVVLDFQRPYIPLLGKLAHMLEQRLPCPLVAPKAYAVHTRGPVLLASIPLDVRPESWIGASQRPVWLELDNRCTRLALTPQGLQRSFAEGVIPQGNDFTSRELFCHYQIKAGSVPTFTLYRTGEDLTALLEKLELLGVEAAIGLYQELKPLLTENG